MIMQLLVFLVGLVLLVVGANLFIKGAGGIALRFGVSPFVVGMVLVGFGTSMPEMAVNLTAVFENRLDLAVGNVVGSNISNVGLILGATALIAPMAIPRRVFRSELPVLVGLSIGFWLLVLDGRLGRIDAAVLLAGFVVMMVVMARGGRAAPAPDAVEAEIGVDAEQARQATWPHAWRLVVGLAVLLGGSKLMVDAAVALALSWGVSELVIGLTVVAVGTSLPELAASVTAALKGQSEIAIGNVLGSNVFNLLLILGVTGMVQPLPVAGSLVRIDIALMVAFVVILYPLAWRKRRLGRIAGVLLLAGFAAFLASQFLRAPLA